MYEYIGERIRKIRASRDLSQKTLGLMLGLSDKAISAYESGRTLPPLDTLFKIAKELEKPVSYFIEPTDNQTTLHDRIVRTERVTNELAKELHEIKTLLKSASISKTESIKAPPPSDPIS